MKKALSVILVVLVVFCALPVTVSAAESGSTNNCTWTLDDDGTLTVNLDGKADNTDAILVKRYAMQWNGAADKIKNMAAGDLNGDDKVDNTDAILLKRCVMNWSGYREKYIVVVNS